MLHSTELEALDTDCTYVECEDHFERFETWFLAKNNLTAEKTTTIFLHFTGKEVDALVKNLVFTGTPVKLSYEGLQTLL